MGGDKKQIKLGGVKEAPSKKKEEPLSKGTLVKGILKLVGRWIPEYPSKDPSEEKILSIAFKDCSEDDKNRGNTIISSEIKRIHSTIEKLTVNGDPKKVVATNRKLFDSMNKCFMALAIEPLRKDFFEVVLSHDALKSNTSFEEHVEKFNILAMYFFGHFGQAYKNLWSASKEEIKKYYDELFPDTNEEKRRIESYTDERLPFDDIQVIDDGIYGVWDI
jgi:hypothetical protein